MDEHKHEVLWIAKPRPSVERPEGVGEKAELIGAQQCDECGAWGVGEWCLNGVAEQHLLGTHDHLYRQYEPPSG